MRLDCGCCPRVFFSFTSCLLLTFTHLLPAQDVPVLHAQSNEVVADLVAVDHNTYKPDRTLKPLDLDIVDNGRPVQLTSFTQSGAGSLRSLAVWVITQCDLKHWGMSGSHFVQGHIDTMADAMRSLAPEDTVAAAGWCDDGSQQVGKPGHDADSVTQDLQQWLVPRNASAKTAKRTGELALQQMLREITVQIGSMQPRPLPVLVFLHQDDTGTQGQEYLALLKILLEQSSLAYLLSDGKGTYQPSAEYVESGNVAHILTQLSADTGGSAFTLGSFTEHPMALSEAFQTIVDRLHGRYQFSFVPRDKDGKVHSIGVTLSASGRASHGGVLLRSRRSYIAPSSK